MNICYGSIITLQTLQYIHQSLSLLLKSLSLNKSPWTPACIEGPARIQGFMVQNNVVLFFLLSTVYVVYDSSTTETRWPASHEVKRCSHDWWLSLETIVTATNKWPKNLRECHISSSHDLQLIHPGKIKVKLKLKVPAPKVLRNSRSFSNNSRPLHSVRLDYWYLRKKRQCKPKSLKHCCCNIQYQWVSNKVTYINNTTHTAVDVLSTFTTRTFDHR